MKPAPDATAQQSDAQSTAPALKGNPQIIAIKHLTPQRGHEAKALIAMANRAAELTAHQKGEETERRSPGGRYVRWKQICPNS